MKDFTHHINPEKGVDGFSVLDGTVKFFGYVRAILLKTGASEVLDFGAGRGAALVEDGSHYRRHLRDLRATGARVTACDIDPVVYTHPASHVQVVVQPGIRLPFNNSSFDVIVSDMTFEHIEDAPFVARELLRTLRPGGWLCARTPNRFGYVRLASELVPNQLHTVVLRLVQPDRKSQDVFPTYYRMNSIGQIKELFPSCAIYGFNDNAEPAYYFGSRLLYSAFLLLHRLLPQTLATGSCFFIQKPKAKFPDPT